MVVIEVDTLVTGAAIVVGDRTVEIAGAAKVVTDVPAVNALATGAAKLVVAGAAKVVTGAAVNALATEGAKVVTAAAALRLPHSPLRVPKL